MTEYGVLIAAMCALVALSGFLFYGKGNEKSARVALGVMLLCALLSGLPSVIEEVKNISFSPENVQIGADSYEDYTEAAFKEGLAHAVSEEFELSFSDVEVELFGFALDTMSAERIVISLRGAAAYADARAVRQYIEKNKLGECEVNVYFE